jgi:hypothetical protein
MKRLKLFSLKKSSFFLEGCLGKDIEMEIDDYSIEIVFEITDIE